MSALEAPSLCELQRWFVSVTTEPAGLSHGGLEQGREIRRRVSPGPELSAAERVQIYNDGYFARLVECLTDDYPALAYALGEETFSSLARAYIDQHPSRSRSLNAYGAQLASFCKRRSERWASFAADLARLEWALVEIVHEPASVGLAPDALAQIPAERWHRAHLLPSHGLRLLHFDYPVNDFFQAFRDEQEPRPQEPSPSATAVYRQGLALWRMGLEPRAALLLQDLISGHSLGDALAALEARAQAAGTTAELAQLLPRWLGNWVQSGFFRAVELA